MEQPNQINVVLSTPAALPSVNCEVLTPGQFRQPIKVILRNGKEKLRKLCRSWIATDTPEKVLIAIKNKKKANCS